VIDSWNRDEFFFQKLPFGKWELNIPAMEGGMCRIPHGSSLKVFQAIQILNSVTGTNDHSSVGVVYSVSSQRLII